MKSVPAIHLAPKVALPLVLILALGFRTAYTATPQAEDKLSERVAKIDDRFVKALEGLAKRYDETHDPEAAHFLASCAIGFGSKDQKIAGIKASREVDVFLARLRGGEVIADPNPIDTALRGLEVEYKKILEPLLPRLKKGELSASARSVVQDLVTKCEIARGAEEYIQAIQRFNKLRKEMGLRAILWDFEKSRQLVLACWYMGETEDYRAEDKSDSNSHFYSEGVEIAKQQCARMVLTSLKDYPNDIRPYALVRQDLLNPDARQIWLAHWSGGRKINPMSVYTIPQVGFREDIPTPSQKYARETLVEKWPGWKDTEDTVQVQGVKVPIVRYPYPAEPDAPPVFSDGRGALEGRWAKSEHDFLAKAGVPIMLRVFIAGRPSDISVALTSKPGKVIPVRVYSTGDTRVDFSGEWVTVLALPETRLEFGSEYTIKVSLKVNDTPIERSWSFKTRQK